MWLHGLFHTFRDSPLSLGPFPPQNILVLTTKSLRGMFSSCANTTRADCNWLLAYCNQVPSVLITGTS